jgi:hypothetical protein
VSWHDFRIHAKTAEAHGLTFTAKSYDWLLWHVLGPFFRLRLSYIDDLERRRIARAERTGDVYRAAWLATHYRSERRRLAIHWSYLRQARDPLLNDEAISDLSASSPKLERTAKARENVEK